MKKGFTMLISTIIIGAIGVAVVTSVLLLGTSATGNSTSLEQSKKARALADTCAEVALQTLHDDFLYTGTSSVSLGDGNCSYTVTAGAGENRTIVVSASVGAVVRKIQINVTQLTGSITQTWEEIQ